MLQDDQHKKRVRLIRTRHDAARKVAKALAAFERGELDAADMKSIAWCCKLFVDITREDEFEERLAALEETQKSASNDTNRVSIAALSR